MNGQLPQALRRRDALEAHLMKQVRDSAVGRANSRAKRPIIAASVALASAAVVVAIAAGIGETAPTSGGLGAWSSGSPFVISTGDYVVAETPQELASRIQGMDIVVEGTVRATTVVTDVASGASVPAIVLDGLTVHKGPAVAGTSLVVSLASGEGQVGLQELSAYFPSGTKVVGYLTPADSSSLRTSAEGATYVANTPQELAIQLAGSDSIIWPLYGSNKVGELAETLPTGSVVGQTASSQTG